MKLKTTLSVIQCRSQKIPIDILSNLVCTTVTRYQVNLTWNALEGVHFSLNYLYDRHMQYVIKETNFKYRFSPSIDLILNVNKRLPFGKFLFLIVGLHACIHYVIRNILMLEIISHCSFACLE